MNAKVQQESGAEVGARYLSLGINVSGLPCLVVGGGRVGTRKALKLAEAGANVTVLAPEVSARLSRAIEEGAIAWLRDEYAPERLSGFVLAVAATDDPALNIRIGRDSAERRILCCVVSPSRFSRVIFPAVWRGDGLTVAIHTDGRDCARTREAREKVAAALGREPRAGRLLGVLGFARRDVTDEFFAELTAATRKLRPGRVKPEGVTELFLLSTCQRWEAYFLSDSPQVAARAMREFVHERCGVLLEAQRDALYLKAGGAARLHLLRVAAGLDSPLVGESEIARQVREAGLAWLSRRDSDLGNILDEALEDARGVRESGGFLAEGRSWPEAVEDFLKRNLCCLQSARVLIIGRGSMGLGVAGRLSLSGTAVTILPARSEASEMERLLRSSDAAVLACDASAVHEAARREAEGRGSLLVVDLSARSSSERCFGLDAFSRTLSGGSEAAQIAAANKKAFEMTLRAAVRGAPPNVGHGFVRVGTRPSELARAQTAEALELASIVSPGVRFEVRTLETPGDRDRLTPLPEAREPGFFTRDIDSALLAGEIDLAVHSAKDLPAEIPKGLAVVALLPAFAPWECLVSRGSLSLADLPTEARVGTSSERRRQEIRRLRPDLLPLDIRGNVPDRLAQLDQGRFDALVLAAAGLIRLGLERHISEVFSPEELPPAPGQGALALVARVSDALLRELLAPLDLGDRRSLPWAQ